LIPIGQTSAKESNQSKVVHYTRKELEKSLKEAIGMDLCKRPPLPRGLLRLRFLISAQVIAATPSMATGGVVQMLRKSLKDAEKDLSTTKDAIKRLTGRDPDDHL